MKNINLKLAGITSLVTLFPMAIGLLLWQDLPNQLPTHFSLTGGADGFSSKLEAIIFLPLVMLGLQWFVIFMTSLDPKSRNVSPKMKNLVYWLIPVINGVLQLSVYGNSLGLLHHNNRIVGILLGFLFVVLGNYFPKTRLNYTVGIRLPWTLNSEENWDKTHRLAGKIWVAGGVILILDALLEWAVPLVLAFVLVVIILVPCLYSFKLNQEEQKKGVK